MEDHILDLSKRHFSHSRHGLVIVGTWVRIAHRWRPCLAVLLAKGPLHPAVIPLEEAWHWSDIGDPLPRAGDMLTALGIDPNDDNVSKLVELVASRLHDLITMPPRPIDAEAHGMPVATVTSDDPFHGKIEIEI